MLAADIRASAAVDAAPRSSVPENTEEDEEGTMEEGDEAPTYAGLCRPVSEAGMFAQSPSAAVKQDVGHVLVRMFKERLSRPALGETTIENLLRSEEGTEDVYHKHYVDSLRKIHEEKERRLSEAALLERHIMQAQARAVTTEDHEYSQLLGDSFSEGFPRDSLQSCLPPVKAHFRCCIDSSLLRHYSLISPDDFTRTRWPRVKPPARSSIPHHTLPAGKNRNMSSCLPLPDISDTRGPVMIHCCDDECIYADYKPDTVPQPQVTQSLDDKKVRKLCRSLQNKSKRQLSLAEKDTMNSGLLSLLATTDHLKNPRFEPTYSKIGAETNLLRWKNGRSCAAIAEPLSKSIDTGVPDTQVFLATPSTIVFTEYKVGQVYEMELELKNVTSVLRRVRVVPPRTCFFSVSLGQFPGDHGLIAGGMSCKYIVRFSPDSLCDFDDVLTVQTQSLSPLCVPLLARRPPPVLTLPNTLDVGSCLVGGIKIVQFTATNRGGEGRFCIIAPDKWPIVHYKSSVSNGVGEEAGRGGGEEGLQLKGVFEIRPTRFELDPGESVPIEILFSPRCISDFMEKILLVCDNCNVLELNVTGEGVVASVDVESVEGGASEYGVGEDKDITAQCLVKFPASSPQESINKVLIIRNNVNVEMPFYWIPVKPHIVSVDPFKKEDDKVTVPKVRVQDLDSSFFIEPRAGYLPAGGTVEFMLSYHPVEVGKHNSCMHLVLRTFHPPEYNKISEKVCAAGEDQSTTDVIKSTILPSNLLNETSEICEATVVELELKGESESGDVYLVPPILHIYGEIPQQTAIRKTFKMCNTGSMVVMYHWIDEVAPHVIQVVPNYGTIGSHGEQLFEMMLSSQVPGNIDQCIHCELSNSTEPLLLRLFANIKGVDLTIEEPDVSFGVVKVGDMKISHLTLVNECRQPASFSVLIVAASDEGVATNNESDCCSIDELTIEPGCGTVAAVDFTKLSVMYRPKVARSLRAFLKICIQDGSTKVVAVRGQSVSPSVSLLNHRLCIADAFINSPVTHNVILVNKSPLSTTYEWGSLEGLNADDCHVSLEPRAGTINASETVNITLTFTGFIEAALCDLKIACHVEGVEVPLYLHITAHVAGLSVSYSLSKEPSGCRLTNVLCMDFGLSVEVGSIVKRYLHIRNNSSLPTAYSVRVDNLVGGQRTSKEAERSQHASTGRRSILSQTMNLTNPNSKTAEQTCSEICQEMLSAGYGAAFQATPSEGALGPFEEVCVTVTSYSDTWGEYSDRLIVEVDALDQMIIPILMTVVGCPLYFLFANPKGGANNEAILRFGSHVVNSNAVLKRARIVNPSAVDVRLDWRTFNQCHASQHLLDIVPVFGRAFPLLDASGAEVRERERRQDLEESMWGVLPNDQVKLIHIKLRSHTGHEKSCPFKIHPPQMIIPARGTGCIEVSFDPKLSLEPSAEECEASCNEEFIHCGRGYMSLEEKDRVVGNHVRRSHQYEVQPLSVCLNAQVIPIRIEVDYESDVTGFDCCLAASDLLGPDGQMKYYATQGSSATLYNRTEAPIQFFISSSEPFSLLELDRLTELPANQNYLTPPSQQINQTELIILKPRGSIVVRVALTLTLELFQALLSRPDDTASLDDDDAVDCDDMKCSYTRNETRPSCLPDVLADTSPPPVSRELVKSFIIEEVTSQDDHQTQSRLLKICKPITIQFTNGASQTLPVYGSVVLPALCLSRDTVDFGTCFIGNAYTVEVQLYNNSHSDSLWTCCEEPLTFDSAACNHDVFNISQSCGKLSARAGYTSEHYTTLCISFAPGSETCYRTSFIFQGRLGEECRTLNVIGSGYLKECLEAPSEMPETVETLVENGE